MARPSKPVGLIKSEGRSHRTKKELELREKGENSLITGVSLKVIPKVKENVVAYKEFKRINSLLKKMEKDDAIYQNIINRYCLIFAECQELENRKSTITLALEVLEESFEKTIEEMRETKEAQGVDILKYITKFTRELEKLNGSYFLLDKQIQVKRRQLLEIEKENVMTIAAALRSIPKTPESESNKNELLRALNGG